MPRFRRGHRPCAPGSPCSATRPLPRQSKAASSLSLAATPSGCADAARRGFSIAALFLTAGHGAVSLGSIAIATVFLRPDRREQARPTQTIWRLEVARADRDQSRFPTLPHFG